MQDETHPRDVFKNYKVSHPALRGRVHDKAPDEAPPALPEVDTETRSSIERVARYLKRVDDLRRDIADLQVGVENAQYGIKAVLLDAPGLRRHYEAFINSGAGSSADDWRRFALATSTTRSARRGLKLVIDNSPPKKRKIKRIKL